MTIASVTGGDIIDPVWGNSVADALNQREGHVICNIAAQNITASFTNMIFASSTLSPYFTVVDATGTVTVVQSGIYFMNLALTTNTGVTNGGTYVHGYLSRNSTGVLELLEGQANVYTTVAGSILLSCTAGQTLSFSCTTSGAGTTSVRAGVLTVHRTA